LRTLSDCSSPSRQHILSNKTYPNRCRFFLAIGVRQKASLV
jgi:hypothetical protein